MPNQILRYCLNTSILFSVSIDIEKYLYFVRLHNPAFYHVITIDKIYAGGCRHLGRSFIVLGQTTPERCVRLS